MVIDRLIENTEAIDFNEVIETSVDQTAKEFIETQQDQMFHGINAKGDSIGKYRSKAYANRKLALNPLGVVDLKLTGEFYKGMFIDPRTNSVVIDSADPKSDGLQKKYKEVFGLSPAYVPEYLKSFSPVATENIINQIHK